jgi:two-component system response regulator YesN
MKTQLSLPTELTCGYFDSSSFGDLKVSPKRRCSLFEIEFFQEDGRNTYPDGVPVPIRRNHVLICHPGQERYSELPFKTKYVKFAVEGKLADVLRAAPRYFHVARSREATLLLDEIITLYTLQQWDEVLLYGKLLNYLSLILEEANRSEGVDFYKNETVRKAREFIEGHFAEPIKLCHIAAAVNLSPNYFHTVFSEVCGITPREYLEEYRIKTAKQLLLTTHLPPDEIAELCGFQTQQYLTSVFRRKVGSTPARFRLRHRNAYFG